MAHPQKFKLGEIVRRGDGSTAIFRIESVKVIDNDDNIYHGTHFFGGYVQADESNLSATTEEEKLRYNAERMKEIKIKPDFQRRVKDWMIACFGEIITLDLTERNHRFLEESLELVQATGCTQSEALQLVDYVFNRPVGEVKQESGGVSVTHAALCIAADIDLPECAEMELARVWTCVEKIRAKQAAKPKHSPLPQHIPSVETVKKSQWRNIKHDDIGSWLLVAVGRVRQHRLTGTRIDPIVVRGFIDSWNEENEGFLCLSDVGEVIVTQCHPLAEPPSSENSSEKQDR